MCPPTLKNLMCPLPLNCPPLFKNLKIKGSSSVIKVGTKVKNIRLVDSDHNIDCKVPGVGFMGLKSEFVKKV